jgi:hypothetical protein
MRTLIRTTLALTLSLLSTTAAARGEAKRTETFVVTPADYIAATLGPGSFISSFPACIDGLDEPAISSGLVLLAKVEAPDGQVVGFGSEQASLDFVNLVSQGTWTLTVPGRGTLMLAQHETLAPLVEIVSEMVAAGEVERAWDPPYVLTTTVPGTGVVVGGTGEFAHAHGSFVEIDAIHYLSLATGALEVTDTLVITHGGGNDDDGR